MPALVKSQIEIKGARVHNLKNIDLIIDRNKFIVITGLSGSGKSSLAFDTIYAEGQRRYVESLSSYARQFLGRMNKPEVDFIHGIPPAIAIEQKVNTRNPRSTVGTSTEIYDYLKLLFARIGKTYSPVSGKEVIKHSVTDVVNFICALPEGKKLILLTKVDFADIDPEEVKRSLTKQGITRVEVDGEIIKTTDLTDEHIQKKIVYLVIDRLVANKNPDNVSRYADSIQTAFHIGNGRCWVHALEEDEKQIFEFSNSFEMDGIEFEEPNVHMFGFNNPMGACPACEGYGKIIGIDEDLVIPDKSLSVYQDAIVCWKGEKMSKWKKRLLMNADQFDFPIHRPYFELSDAQKELLWTGNTYFKGLNAFFDYLETKKYKIQYRVMLSRYRGRTTCTACKGKRLKKETGYVKINGYAIQDLIDISIDKLQQIVNGFKLTRHEQEIGKRLLTEIRNRVSYLCDVGLSYLTLNRLSSTLSGGESQRINLATMLGSSLVGSLYVLDEPSIGLHPRDTHRLIKVLNNLKKLGNTILVVEHEEEIIKASDDVIDIGPLAGRLGGEILFSGEYKKLLTQTNSLTAEYLTGKQKIELPSGRRNWNNYIEICGACENNLKNIDVKIPLDIMTVVTGVSGSGKSSLVQNILYQAMNKLLNGYGEKTGQYSHLAGDLEHIRHVEFVDQNPIGKSSRSNPVTYLKAFDEIRKLYSQQPYAQMNGYKASHFSFNIDGGRCEECQGEGVIKVEMQFMADIILTCESCNGKRFKEDILEVRYREKNIYDILEMSVDEAIDFFSGQKGSTEKKIVSKIKPLADVGLGYVKLGQSSSTLSGGESQRVKLASFIGHEKSEPTLFIFDEPTTGLHFHDIRKLLDSFNALLARGHTILIVEHNQEIIKSADWIIDLGPEGGNEGGYLVFEGTPENIVHCENSYTGKFLSRKLTK